MRDPTTKEELYRRCSATRPTWVRWTHKLLHHVRWPINSKAHIKQEQSEQEKSNTTLNFDLETWTFTGVQNLRFFSGSKWSDKMPISWVLQL